VDTLYHYCSTDTFTSIIRGRAIWLSALSLSNDTLEGKLVRRTLTRLAGRDNLDSNAQDGLWAALASLEGMLDGLGFCLSEEGDLLSQWRGYAANATGVSIGFASSYLTALGRSHATTTKSGFSLWKVSYSDEEHEESVAPIYQGIPRHIAAGAFDEPGTRGLLDGRSAEEVKRDDNQIADARRTLRRDMLDLIRHLYRLKDRAFREEKEWRLVSFVLRALDDDYLYRAAHDRIIPYRQYELVQAADLGPAIKEVILGPKHVTPPEVVKGMLRRAGFGEVEIRRSEASYR